MQHIDVIKDACLVEQALFIGKALDAEADRTSKLADILFRMLFSVILGVLFSLLFNMIVAIFRVIIDLIIQFTRLTIIQSFKILQNSGSLDVRKSTLAHTVHNQEDIRAQPPSKPIKSVRCITLFGLLCRDRR